MRMAEILFTMDASISPYFSLGPFLSVRGYVPAGAGTRGWVHALSKISGKNDVEGGSVQKKPQGEAVEFLESSMLIW